MTMDCQWLETKLEAFFTGELTTEEERRARGHIDACSNCRQEIQALHAIDPLIQNYFQYELRRALKPRSRTVAGRPRRALGVGLAATALAGILLVFALRSPQVITVPALEPAQPQIAPAASETTPPNIKADVTAEAKRAKPSPGGEKQALEPSPVQGSGTPIPGSGPDGTAPDFLVTDPAGYSRTLEDYRGHVLLIGVWSGDQPKAAASLERLYKTFGSNTNLRLIGVSYERQAKPTNTTFPVVYNQGSRLLDAKPGEFVLLDKSGSVRLRGSLIGDLGNLQTLLKKN
ncbi:MAG: hypothetical protein DMG13_19780 [Acidobacteria bacterium]|nr:MAG: hypothetical protein DMG13_19780 [Acidobacteriota bacterium]